MNEMSFIEEAKKEVNNKLGREQEEAEEIKIPRKIRVYLTFDIDRVHVSDSEIIAIQDKLRSMAEDVVKHGIEYEVGRKWGRE